MSHIFDLVNGTIIPTPGAVMDTTMLLDELFDGVHDDRCRWCNHGCSYGL
jgi:hypothetical protein